MDKMPWVKLWKNVLKDEKISFLIARYGHEVCTLWIGILTSSEAGVLVIDEDILAAMCHIEEKRYQELRGVFVARGLIVLNDEDLIEIPNWDEYQLGESTERVRAYRERRRHSAPTETNGAKPEAAPDAPLPEHSCNAEETATKRAGNGDVTGELEGELEGEFKITHTARARDEPEGAGPLPAASPAPAQDVYPRAVYDEWAALGDRVYQPGDYATAFASRWGELRRHLGGRHSNEVLAAIRNFGAIIAGPPGKYYWSQRIALATFVEKHLEAFLPQNFREEDFLARAKKGHASPKKVETREELERLRDARVAVYGKEAADAWFAKRLEAAG